MPKPTFLIGFQQKLTYIPREVFRLVFDRCLVGFVTARLRCRACVVAAFGRGPLPQIIGFRVRATQARSGVDHVVDFRQPSIGTLLSEESRPAGVG